MTHREYLIILCADPIFGTLIFLILLMRRRAASFPIFTTYVAIDTVILAVLAYPSYHSSHIYWKIYWPLNFIDQTIQLLVAYEISKHVFRPTGAWAPDVRKSLIATVSGSITIAFLFALLMHPQIRPFSALMWRINLFYTILICELFVGMLVLSSTAGLPWNTHAARIAQAFSAGTFFSLLIQIVISSVDMDHLRHIYSPLMLSQMTFAVVCQMYLVMMMWRDAPIPQKLPEHRRDQIYTLQQQAENDLTKIRSWRNS
jgi:hypothetical protein